MERVVGKKEVRWDIFGEKLRSLEKEFEVLRPKSARGVNLVIPESLSLSVPMMSVARARKKPTRFKAYRILLEAS